MDFTDVYSTATAISGAGIFIFMAGGTAITLIAVRQAGVMLTLLAAGLTVFTLALFSTVFAFFVYPIMGFIYVVSPSVFYGCVIGAAYVVFMMYLGRLMDDMPSDRARH